MTIQNRIGRYLQPGRSWNERNVNTITKFSIHHDAIPQGKSVDDTLNIIYAAHKANGWPGTSYHYYIHPDGQIFQLNEHKWVTWIDGINYDALGIVMGGFFHTPHNNEVQPAQRQALKELLDWLCTKHPEFPADQNDVYGHRERAQTSCPGDKVFPLIKEYREKAGNVDWGQPTPPPASDDEKRALNQVQEVRDRDHYGNLESAARAMNDATQKLPQLNAEISKLNEKINKAKVDLA